jgi:cystathionine gamma-synthase
MSDAKMDAKMNDRRIETVAVHAGLHVDPGTGAVTPAIHPSTTFEREVDGSYPRGFLYSRNSTPNRAALEECLTALEGGQDAAAFASASAATAAILLSLEPGDHVVAPMDAYHGTLRLLRETFARWKLDTTFVDMTDAGAARAAIRTNTRLVWVETPSNPLWKVTDIAAVGEIARRAGVLYVCDNTTATPVLQSPFELGADLVLHATTKYLGGHSDVLGGAVVARTRDAMFERIRAVQASGGAVPSPFDCWLVLRGIRTLPYRMRAHSENALKVATFLHGHARVEAVHYPGLPTHPAHDVARRQMTAFGGMLSVQVRGDQARAMQVAAKLRVFTRATSFGGTESLVEHRASIEGAGTRTPENLLRLSIGLEHPDDLIDDLDQALA